MCLLCVSLSVFLSLSFSLPLSRNHLHSILCLSKVLRRLVKSGVLQFTDMSEAPEKFFLAHRLLSTVGLGGFGIRFTVQYNLFAGSIVGLAGEEQLGMLDEIQRKGQLGCFLLTEMQAGVLSGLIVETTADWNNDTQTFDLHTPSDKAAKNWISQGYTAELGVVIADLRVDGKSHGPHPFFLQLRDGDTNALMPGIRVEDMGIKTIANDLDNARVWFDHVQLPRDALLNKFCEIDDDGAYQVIGDEPMRIEVIGQRLLTGRQCIAEAAILSARVLHMKTEAYAQEKVCNGLAGETSLASMPQLRSVFEESYRQLDEMMAFTSAVEEKLAECLRHGKIPDEELVDAISVCKIRCIDVAIQRVHALRMEVGSYALMHDTGFELVDMFLCCKFAEGDSRILQQKLMRDRLKKMKTEGAATTLLKAVNPFSAEQAEAAVALSLGQKLQAAGRDRAKMAQLMEQHWEQIYELSRTVEERIIRTTPPSAFPEPIVERLARADTDYDDEWKEKVIQWKEELSVKA
jgi:acyl-CoA oxidase